MTSRILAAPALGAVAVAAMLAATATSTEAFTLSAPSVEKSVAGADIDHVYYYHGGGYHYGYHGGYATMPATMPATTMVLRLRLRLPRRLRSPLLVGRLRQLGLRLITI